MRVRTFILLPEVSTYLPQTPSLISEMIMVLISIPYILVYSGCELMVELSHPITKLNLHVPPSYQDCIVLKELGVGHCSKKVDG